MDDEDAARLRIDAGLLNVLDRVAEYRRLRDEASASLRQAFFDLARAKRSAGYQWISPDLYSAHPRAIATVSVDETHPIDNAAADESKIFLVNRRMAEDSDQDNSGSDDEKPRARKPSKDPLLWFGMLVPPALKDAQKGFVASLDSLARLAHLAHTIQREQERLQLDMDAVDALPE
ncbi:hypothetical protein GGI11_000768 [Coemansia sp. RSA 2049]|nr:hypothetical protein H4217_006378 [Coemansia sp. RSA 1939]KAJ2524511.1 hypothetical protein GGI11_000768 [Coemansia sp. RSA 2049]KAJ2615995.1 hypothetical protein EV177_001284 [Coemansia sp. RSA 1804]KAJ2692238.1 hypothetical protein GGH99_001860 [Coemansia sp. RSA 1285]